MWPAEGIWKCIRSPAWLWLQDSAAETVHLRVCVNGRVVDKLESRNGTQSTTVTEPVQSLKHSSSCPADLSHGIVNADFVIFFREVLEFGSFHSRVFCFTVSRHHTSFSTGLFCMFLHPKTFNDSTDVALIVSVHVFCLQNCLSCYDCIGRFCGRLWI